MSLRLLIVTPFLEAKGGLERVILKMAQHFDAKIHCVSYNPRTTFPEFESLDIEVAKPSFLDRFPLSKRLSAAMSAGYHFYNVKFSDYDVLNAHQTPSEWVRNKNQRVIWYCNSPNREAFDLYSWRMSKRGPLSKAFFWASISAFKQLEFRTVPKIEHIFANSMNVQSRIRKYLNRDSEVLYLAVEHEKFSNKESEKFFFYPSRLVPEKHFEYCIEAFRIFSLRNKGWKFVIAGSLSSRPEHQEYFKRLKSMAGGIDGVEFITNLEDNQLVDLYSRCYAVLYSPISEDFGLVPLEGMASGKPCIAKNEGGPKETILEGIDGFLVDSSARMAQRMEWLVKNPDRCIEMGKAGTRKVKKDFTWERFLKRFGEKAREIANK